MTAVAPAHALLAGLAQRRFPDKSVLILGAGWMATEYCRALEALGVEQVTVVARSAASATKCCEPFGFKPVAGGYEQDLGDLGTFDLIIVALPVLQLLPAARAALRQGCRTVLVEKPGSLYSAELSQWADEIADAPLRVRIAYNRLVYPHLWQLKERVAAEGGITSARYTFTELVRTINFDKNPAEVTARWGVANSAHVISMAHDLIGMPAELSALHDGSLDWHPSGAQFVGAGRTEQGIPFSYHADWASAGRWGIEVMTREHAYRLMPLEELWQSARGTFDWQRVPATAAFPGIKLGVAEQVALMLDAELENLIPLTTVRRAAALTSVVERVCNYQASR